jgi:DNA-binding NarL/FixJ family response regulator
LDAAQIAIEKQTFENLQKQAKEILSRGNQRKRILEAFNTTYPHAYERLKATYPDLTEQECDLLVLNFLEFRIKEEAEILELSQNTVMKYRSNLIKKVGKDPFAGLLG